MTDDELVALEQAAKATTPGPWDNIKGDMSFDILNNKISAKIIASCDCSQMGISEAEIMTQKNIDFIAASTPAAVLSLIQELRQTQIERDWLAEKCESMAHALDACEFYPAYYWKDRARQYVKEIACQKN